jgi:hypothetical protein
MVSCKGPEIQRSRLRPVQGQMYEHGSAPVHDWLDLALRDTILVMSATPE